MKRFSTLSLAACLAVAAGGPALAGPCADQIAALGRQLSQSPAMGPATTGALAGSGPQAGVPAATASGGAQPDVQGTSATGKLGGEGGTKEMNAASSQVATSAQDVRRQQTGMPTMAADPGARLPAADEKISQAKTELATAEALDQKNDAACNASVQKVQALLK